MYATTSFSDRQRLLATRSMAPRWAAPRWAALLLTALLLGLLTATESHAQRWIGNRMKSFDTSKAKKAEKSIQKAYDQVPNTQLVLSAKFADVNIESWDQPRMEVDVKVEVWAKSDDVAQALLQKIDLYLYDSRPADEVVLKNRTDFSDMSRREQASFQITYIIKMPKSARLMLDGRHSELTLPDLDGRAMIDLAHSNFSAGRLMGDDSEIKIAHGKGRVVALGEAEIDQRHGDMNVGSAQRLRLDLAHADLDLDEVGSVDANIAHADLNLRELNGSLEANVAHGEVRVRNVAPSVTNIEFDGAHASLELEFHADAAFQFAVETNHGGFRSNIKDITLTRQNRDRHRGEYEGTRGTNPQMRVTADGSHSDITFR